MALVVEEIINKGELNTLKNELLTQLMESQLVSVCFEINYSHLIKKKTFIWPKIISF